MFTRKVILSCAAMLTAACGTLAQAQTSTEHAPGRAYFTPNERFAVRSGEDVYATVCQGCHMPQGQGATGAGVYSSFVANPKLASSQYVAYMVVNGRKAMPPFGNALDDEQVANVVNYVRTHFGNSYPDVIKPTEVKTARPAPVAAR